MRRSDGTGQALPLQIQICDNGPGLPFDIKDEIFDLSYEELISNQEETTKRLLNFCNLEWDPNCLSPHKNTKTVSTASLAQVRSPVYKSSIKKWEKFSNELSELKNIIK